MNRPRRFRWMLAAVVALAFAHTSAPQSPAGEIWLKNGTHMSGELVPIKGLTAKEIRRLEKAKNSFSILMVDSVFKRYFVPYRKQVEKSVWTAGVAPDNSFRIKQRRSLRKAGFSRLGAIKVKGPFSKFGVRTVEVQIPGGTEQVVQGVVLITPKYVLVRALNRKWEFGIATNSLPSTQLDAMIRQVTDQKKPADRMAISRFYIAAEMYPQAARELVSIGKDFTEYKTKVKEVQFQLRQFQGQQIIAELRRRKAAGQHRLVLQSCNQFPTKDISAALLQEIKSLKADYAKAKNDAERATMLLSDLQSQLKDPQLIAAVKPFRSAVRAELTYDTLPRLRAFLNLAADNTLSAADKLALAYSGWILGSANAIQDLELTIRMWTARFLVTEYLATVNSIKRTSLLDKLKATEGVAAEHIGRMIAFLPARIESPDIKPGVAHTVTVAGRDGQPPIKYSVLLPFEYRPHRKYPMIVALHPSERPPQDELLWWGGKDAKSGQSHRHGYIVIAPHYATGKTGGYDYNTTAHAIVLETIRDARKRFRVDSDRVFLSGHGSGGDAAFDIGMSHPDLFAGLIPINGICDKYCKWYYHNAVHLPLYLVTGELSRNSMRRNGREMERMLRGIGGLRDSRTYDVIYCEYVGRGYESYYEEIHNLFDWMGRLKRAKYVKSVDMKILRPSDDRFYWVRTAGFQKNVTQNQVLVQGVGKPADRPTPLQVKVERANRIRISRGGSNFTLWLSPDIIDFEKRVYIKHGETPKFRGFLKRNITVLLEDLRVRGDREKPYWAKIEISRFKRTASVTAQK